MSAKHTPGPWDARSFNGGVFAQDVFVASVYGDDPDCRPDDRMRANARLIAAAPELLDALIELADCGAEAWGEDRPCVRIARAAIAKAAGGKA